MHVKSFTVLIWTLLIPALFLLPACGADGIDGIDGIDGLDYPGAVPTGYTDADGIVGGAAYNEWFVTEAGGDGSLLDYSITVGSDFVRCKACHGWDGLGNQGSYAGRSGQSTGKATRPDVSSVNLWDIIRVGSVQQLFDAIQNTGGRVLDSTDNGHPDFSGVLTDAQTWNLVKYMREEWIRPEELYTLTVTGAPIYTDFTGAVVPPGLVYSGIGTIGDSANGDLLWSSFSCVTCHGADGKALGAGMVDGFDGVGAYLRAKPNEAWQKIKFGVPGTVMNSSYTTDLAEIQDLYKALTNTTTYPD